MSKPNSRKRERENKKFTAQHPELPKGTKGGASRKEYAKLKREKSLIK